LLCAVFLISGVAVGWFASNYGETAENERYASNLLKWARFAQAKERTTLLRLLETGDAAKAREILYIVLRGNFDEYAEKEPPTSDVCELFARLGGSAFLASTPEPGGVNRELRETLVRSIQSVVKRCGQDGK
jgi:hypothetical protein